MLRPAEDRDLDTVREWRNQPANRQVSIHQQVITPGEHAAWWARARRDPARRVLIYEYDGRGLGVVTFFDIDLQARRAGWGFFLDNATTTAEGTAMMAWMQVMKEATGYAFDELGLDVLTGEVLEGNQAVRLMNRRFRFTEGLPERREVDGVTITVIPISLRRGDRRGQKDNQHEQKGHQ